MCQSTLSVFAPTSLLLSSNGSPVWNVFIWILWSFRLVDWIYGKLKDNLNTIKWKYTKHRRYRCYSPYPLYRVDLLGRDSSWKGRHSWLYCENVIIIIMATYNTQHSHSTVCEYNSYTVLEWKYNCEACTKCKHDRQPVVLHSNRHWYNLQAVTPAKKNNEELGIISTQYHAAIACIGTETVLWN